MSFYAILKILTAIISVGIGAGLLARDHGLKGYRLLAAVMFCNAWWASAEFLLAAGSAVEDVDRLQRLASLGPLPLGVLCMHSALEFSSLKNHRLTPLLPVFYAAVTILAPIHLLTDFAIRGTIETSYVWKPVFGPGIALSYLVISVPIFLILLSRREVVGQPGPGGQRELARVVFFGVSGALGVGTLSILVLPFLGIDVMNITSTLLMMVGVSCIGVLRRSGHSLTSSQAFAREILDALTDGYVLVTEEGIIRDANRSFLKMAGATHLQAIGASVGDWIADLAESHTSLESAQLMELRTNEDDLIPVVVSPSAVSERSARRLGHAFLLRDRREVIALQRKLVVSARLAAVGDLAKSISQSISEPVLRARQELAGLDLDWQTIGDVIFLSDREQMAQEAFEEGAELIAECAEGINRIFSIVQEVGVLSDAASSEELHSHSLDQIVARAIRVAGVQASDALRIEVRLDENVNILCHPSEIERVVINLVVNAIQALQEDSGGDGQLSVAVISQGQRALLHVEDNGCGIEGSVLDRVFDPFFTTKPVGKGTGLGLAISYQIVKSHGGEIRISSEAGAGTSVAVEFPCAPSARGTADSQPPRSGVQPG